MKKRAFSSNLKKNTQADGATKESSRVVSSHIRLRLFLVAALVISLIPFSAITARELDNPQDIDESEQLPVAEVEGGGLL